MTTKPQNPPKWCVPGALVKCWGEGADIFTIATKKEMGRDDRCIVPGWDGKLTAFLMRENGAVMGWKSISSLTPMAADDGWYRVDPLKCDMCVAPATWKHPEGGFRCEWCPRPVSKTMRGKAKAKPKKRKKKA